VHRNPVGASECSGLTLDPSGRITVRRRRDTWPARASARGFSCPARTAVLPRPTRPHTCIDPWPSPPRLSRAVDQACSRNCDRQGRLMCDRSDAVRHSTRKSPEVGTGGDSGQDAPEMAMWTRARPPDGARASPRCRAHRRSHRSSVELPAIRRTADRRSCLEIMTCMPPLMAG
jgi:hypothetical protein